MRVRMEVRGLRTTVDGVARFVDEDFVGYARPAAERSLQ
jgi:hypothetical protein